MTGEGRSQPLHLALAALLYALFAVFLLWPILQVVHGGFVRADGGITLDFVSLVFRDPVLRSGLFNATFVALLLTLILMFFLHQLQQTQEKFTHDTEHWIDQHLIRHMQVR